MCLDFSEQENIVQASISLLGLELEEVLKQLSGYNITLIETNANSVLNKKNDPSEYSHAKALRIDIVDNNATIVYALFKDIEDKINNEQIC